jgi:sugar transferase (PEP-CTERM system associated)
MRIANHYVPRITAFLLVLDFFIALIAVYLAAMIRFGVASYPYQTEHNNFLVTSLFFALAITFSLSAFGIYGINYHKGFTNTYLRLMFSMSFAAVLMVFIFYVLPDLFLGRGILVLIILITTGLIFAVRLIVFKSMDFEVLKSRIAFLGCGDLANDCRTLALNQIPHQKYSLIGFIPVDGEEHKVPRNEILFRKVELSKFLLSNNVAELVVSVLNKRGCQFPLEELLDCKLQGIKVTDANAFFEREACQIQLRGMHPGTLIFGEGFNQSFLRGFIKRAFDLLASLVIFTLSLPTMLIAVLAISLEDQGPIFYRQERVGLNGQTYNVLKFRSMRVDAEASGNPQWATTNDPRITKVGRLLRKLRIDELPQLINVLKGEMSFVGPRPERPYFVQQLCSEIPFYNIRHSIKPGITGMAQVRYGYAATKEDAVQKLQYDLYYVKNNSLFLDILIMIETVQVVLFGKGAR